MAVTITHTTPADGTFSATGAAAWDANHAVSGLGTMAEQNANNVNITGGSITGVTGLVTTLTANSTPTSGFSAGQFLTSDGTKLQATSLGTISTQNSNSVAITGGNIDGTAIGATTQSSAKLTTLDASGTLTFGSYTGYLYANGAGAVTAATTIPNSGLANSSLTINGTSVSLGGSATISASTTGTLTLGTGLSGTSFNGSTNVTAAIADTSVVANSYGSTSAVATFTVNAQGQLTAAANATISIAASQINTTIPISGGGTGQTTASAAFNALSPITSTGDLIIGNGTNSATRLAIGSNNTVLTSNGTTASWAALPANVSSLSFGTTGLTPSAATQGAVTVAGTLVAANGGTGQSSYAVGDLLYASGTTALSKLADVATGSVLVSGGVGVAPAWSASPRLTTSLTTPLVIGGTAASSSLTLQSTSGIGTTDSIIFKTGNNGATTSMTINSSGVLEGVGGTLYNIASQYDIGTNPNQIPLNQYLGTMAYQDAAYLNVGSIYATGNVAVGTTAPTARLMIAAGAAAASSAPLKFTSGANLTTPEAGAVEYDGTVMTATPNTNFRRGTIPLTNYTSGAGTALGTNTEATNAVLLPAANDTITLSVGTYFVDLCYIVTRGPTSTTSATARLNIRGSGTAVGNFSGMSISAPTEGGASANFAFDAANITADNVVTAASTTAAGVYTIHVRGVLKITTSGTVIPQYSLSANINAAGTVSKVLYFKLQQLDTQSATAFGPAGTGWA